jgi:glycosyltransferase involved in cell wall biosynthesis/GT2 family glycosyltransferase
MGISHAQHTIAEANVLLRKGSFADALLVYDALMRSTSNDSVRKLLQGNIEATIRRMIMTPQMAPLPRHISAKLSVGTWTSFVRHSKIALHNSAKRVCLVTDELAGIPPSGGIGAAFLELARTLSQSGFEVDVLYCQARYFDDRNFEASLRTTLNLANVRFFMLDPYRYTVPEFVPSKLSYAIFRWLDERDGLYSAIHFHDYKGLAFYSVMARNQGLSLRNSNLVVQVHGPSRWAFEANCRFFAHPEALRIDYMERLSVELCDHLVAPSQYILDWLEANDFETRPCKSVRVIPNCLPPQQSPEASPSPTTKGMRTIVFFGRHEQRKGLRVFCAALNLIKEALATHGIKVVFLGALGEVNDAPSLFHLEACSTDWDFDFELITNLTRDGALEYILRQNNPVVCICSPHENSPYTVFEMMHLGVPVIASGAGGAVELFADRNYPGMIDMEPRILADALLGNLHNRMPAPQSAHTPESIQRHWINFHDEIRLSRDSRTKSSLTNNTKDLPLVSVVITHHERPHKLNDAIDSILLQKYPNIELIVVDDGSPKAETREYLETVVAPKIRKAHGTLIYRENGYLGAARNTGLKAAKGDYICFLDDDDVALPDLVSDLVVAATYSGARICVALNTYMPADQRTAFTAQNASDYIASYLPTGGPHSLGALENCFGAATGLFETGLLRDLGGYSEMRGVGHEDYELYTKLSSLGHRIWVLPKVLYCYEVGTPSMLSQTTLSENFMRNHKEFLVDTRSRDLVGILLGQKLESLKHSRFLWTMAHRNQAHVQAILNASHSRDATLKAFLELLTFEGKQSHPLYMPIHADLSRCD